MSDRTTRTEYDTEDDRAYDETRYDEGYDDDEYAAGEYDEDEGTWLDEGLITLTILVGVALFVFPEPATSGIGVALILIGATAWLIDWMM